MQSNIVFLEFNGHAYLLVELLQVFKAKQLNFALNEKHESANCKWIFPFVY